MSLGEETEEEHWVACHLYDAPSAQPGETPPAVYNDARRNP
jgi:hypothetical protein